MLNFLFLNLNNPLIIRLILILQTILLNLIIGKIYFTFWFSYIIFLIFIGGLFILFIYILSIIYNNLIFIKKLKYLSFIRIFIFIIIALSIFFNNFFFFNYDLINIDTQITLKENYLNIIKFFNFPNNIINLIIIIYLFILIIIVVKITNFLKGPIRSTN